MRTSRLRILILGGSGFIGKNLSEYLKRKSTFEVLTPSSTQCDALKYSQVRDYIAKHQPNIIINFVFIFAPSQRAYFTNKYMFDNIKIITNIVKAAKKSGRLKKVFSAGTSFEYGDSTDKIHERKWLDPHNSYAVVKCMTSLLSIVLARELEVPLTLLRFFNVYGRYETKSVIYRITKSILDKKNFQITAGRAVRDYMYIDDLVEILHRAIKKCKMFKDYEVYNVCSSQPVTIHKLLQTLFKTLNYTYTAPYKPDRKDDYFHQVGDNRKLKRIINLPSFTPLKIGMKETVKWIKADLGHT